MLPQLAACDPQALGLIFDLLDDDARYEQGFQRLLAGFAVAHVLKPLMMPPQWCRQAAAAVSRGWRSTVRSDPRFWPTVILRGSKAVVRTKGWMLKDRALSGGTAANEVDGVLVAWETGARARALSQAARISARTERIRLEGFNDQVGRRPFRHAKVRHAEHAAPALGTAQPANHAILMPCSQPIAAPCLAMPRQAMPCHPCHNT